MRNYLITVMINFAATIAIVLVALAMIALIVVTAVILATALLFLITRNILTVVPVVLHKVDALATGIVFAAVFPPVFCMTIRHAQIDRRAFYRYPLNYSGPEINQLWWLIVADVESAIEAGLADAD